MGSKLSGCGMCCSRDPQINGTYIFHYGGSSPGVIAERLGRQRSDIIARSLPCVIKNYTLAFAGKSK
jgi:hypothetical protein